MNLLPAITSCAGDAPAVEFEDAPECETLTLWADSLPDAATQELRALLLRRRQVVDMLTAERHRLGTVPSRMHQAMQQPIAWLAGQLRSLDAGWASFVELVGRVVS